MGRKEVVKNITAEKAMEIRKKRAAIIEMPGFKGKMSRTWMGMKDNKVSYAMLAPFLLCFITFTLIPVLVSLFFGFTDFDLVRSPNFVGFDNYIRMFLEDDIFMIAVKNTLMFAIITGPLSYLLCFLFAWFISDMSPKARAFFTVVFYAPNLAPIYWIWLIIFSNDSYGLLNSFLIGNGFIDNPILWLADAKYQLGVVIIVQLWMSLGTAFITFVAGFLNMDVALSEAGAIDGISNKFQELIYIVLPQMVPQLMFGAVMQIATSFSVSGQSSALVGFPSTDYAAHTIVLHIQDYGSTRFELGYACAMTFILFLAMLFIKWVINKALSKISSD